MNHLLKLLLPLAALIVATTELRAQEDVYREHRERWRSVAESLIPELHVTEKQPLRLVETVPDTGAWQQMTVRETAGIQTLYNTPLKAAGRPVVVDFGEHLTGHLRFVIASTVAAHAPGQLRFKFAEVPAEMAASFADYRGALSGAWLQEEILTLHEMPDTVTLPRRYAFRYLQIEVLKSAADMDFYIRALSCRAVTSAGPDDGAPDTPLAPRFQAIEDVSLKTLRECMQTVFEDGPKRDRRIWVGDLKLQALANYQSFRHYDLVRRGLYLYAATADSAGLVYGTLFERPAPHPQRHFPIDYSLLYNTVLYDYYLATGDLQTLQDLWVIARRQVQLVLPHISADGLFTPSPAWWYFIDWNDRLDKGTALHGTALYAFGVTLEMAEVLGRQGEVAELPAVIRTMKRAAREKLRDRATGLFVSGPERQISTASQVWMVLSGAVSPAEGKVLLERLAARPDAVQPISPYLYHYVLEAMIRCGLHSMARELIADYWGGMVDVGADTFWEVYDPADDFISPYGSHLINSYCHAWSCTPVYFLRKYRRELFGE
jgi:alpha-L-rhamnosidase